MKEPREDHMKFLASVALAALLVLPLAAQPSRADEDAEDRGDTLVTRLFDVSALTQGRADFMRELSPSVEPGSEDMSPLFGTEGREPLWPVGQVDELIELVRNHVSPDTWESTLGADMRAMGEHTLVVRAFPEIVDAVAAYVAELQKRIMRRVAVDVETFHLSAAEVTGLLLPGNPQLVDPKKLEALRDGEKASRSCPPRGT